MTPAGVGQGARSLEDEVVAPDGQQLALVWGRRTDVVWRYTGDGLLLLAIDAGDPDALDAAGTVVWEELRHPATSTEVVRRVAARVGASASVVEAGVLELLGRLAGQYLTTSGHA